MRSSLLVVRWLWRWLWLWLWGLAACSPNAADGLAVTQPPDQFLDYNEFVCHVQPTLIRGCSFLGCHGSAEHAFRLYSLGKLRMMPEPLMRKQRSYDLLTADEVERNFESASGMLYGTSAADRANWWVHPSRVPLLAKPLAARYGGSEHAGYALFPFAPARTLADDLAWQALIAWVAGAAQPASLDPDCASFFDSLGLVPRVR